MLAAILIELRPGQAGLRSIGKSEGTSIAPGLAPSREQRRLIRKWLQDPDPSAPELPALSTNHVASMQNTTWFDTQTLAPEDPRLVHRLQIAALIDPEVRRWHRELRDKQQGSGTGKRQKRDETDLDLLLLLRSFVPNEASLLYQPFTQYQLQLSIFWCSACKTHRVEVCMCKQDGY